jgi:hypothetical protein
MRLKVEHNTSRYVSNDVQAAYDIIASRCVQAGHGRLGDEEAQPEWTINFYTGATKSGLPETAPWHYQRHDVTDFAVMVPEQVGGSPMEHLSQGLLAKLSEDETKSLLLLLRRSDPRLVRCTGMMAETAVRRKVLEIAQEIASKMTIGLRPMDKQLRAASRKENGKFRAIRLRELADSRTTRIDHNLKYDLRRRLWLAGTTAAAAEVACRRHGIEGPKQPVSTKPEILDKMRELLELLGG